MIEAPTLNTSDSICFVVASRSAQHPRIIVQGQSGKYSCETSCPMWQSSKICSHCVAAAQFSGNLEAFIRWYRKSKSLPNFDKLSKVNMPKGSGRKGEKPPRKRKKTKAAPLTLVEQDVPLISEESEPLPDQPAVPDTQPHSKHYSPPWAPPYPYRSPWAAADPFLSTSYFSGYTQMGQLNQMGSQLPVGSPSYYGDHTHIARQTPPVSSASYYGQTERPTPISVNPFFVRKISGNIRICQGCRSSLRTSDGSIPPPPMDITIARLEQHSYYDKAAGSFCTPKKESNSHYHPRMSCITLAEPYFQPSK